MALGNLATSKLLPRIIFGALLVSTGLLTTATAGAAEDLTITVVDVYAQEASGIAEIEFSLSEPSSVPVRVSFSTRAAKAISGRDYVSRSGRVTFPPGSLSVTTVVRLVDDGIDEPDQHFALLLRNPLNASLSTTTSRVFIQDDDPAPHIRFKDHSADFAEGTSITDTIAGISVVLSHRSEKPIRFTVHTAINTASASEFRWVAERVLFDAPGRRYDYPVEIRADDDPEGRQQFYLFMRNPSNAILDTTDSTYFRDDRIRTKIRILDDDPVVGVPIHPSSDRSFFWVGAFERSFTEHELDSIAANNGLVVLAKFHAGFSIEAHHADATSLAERQPGLDILPYFNATHWFVDSEWGTVPPPDCLLRDSDGNLLGRDTDRSFAHYLDLRAADCREWILTTVQAWLAAAPYTGIAFDSAGPIGDHGEGTAWQDTLGGQIEVDAFNAGLADLLASANARFADKDVIFNGIAATSFSGPGRDLAQLDYTDGALHEEFGVTPDGRPSPVIRDDIGLLETSTSTLLMKTNLRDTGDPAEVARAGRFSYGAFLMGWQPGRSFFKLGVDDFYDVSELLDDPTSLAVDLGDPVATHIAAGDLLTRQFVGGRVAVNLGATDLVWATDTGPITVRAEDATFVINTDGLSPLEGP